MQLNPGWPTAILGVNLFWLLAATITFGLRIYVRVFKLRRVRSDDYLMVACWMFYLAYQAVAFQTIHYGGGNRDRDVAPADRVHARYYWFLTALMYEPTTVLLKLSAGAFILNVTNNKIHKIILYVLGIASIVFGFLYWMVILLQCRPISHFWRINNPDSHGTCLDPHFSLHVSYAASALNTIADLIYAILPFHLLWHAQFKLRTKITVCILLCLGSVAGIATIARFFYLKVTLLHAYGEDSDFFYNSSPIAVLSTLELGLGITATCAATLRPLFDRRAPRAISTKSGPNSHMLSQVARSTGQAIKDLRRQYGPGTARHPHDHHHHHGRVEYVDEEHGPDLQLLGYARGKRGSAASSSEEKGRADVDVTGPIHVETTIHIESKEMYPGQGLRPTLRPT